ncbi:glutaminase [Formosa sp. 3Alg 14/1]|uniref:glutaminase n=1 Tax=Formosa sp. 3Alg 14/1 TaxID=3382190 RepID=UPI0039BEBD83
MDFKDIIQDIYKNVKAMEDCGALPTYIPDLAEVDPNKFGVHITTMDCQNYGVGDCYQKFSIQSIAKVLSLILAYKLLGAKIWERVDVEPSGNAFNSLLQLEVEKGIPRNPFINAGALVIADILLSELKNPKAEFLAFVRDISNNEDINYSSQIAASEKEVGFRNIALCNFIKSLGNIKNNPADVLDLYFDICSLEMHCKDLSELFLFLANNGKKITDKTPILTETQSKRINALMQTCGFYDESGEFAFRVGLPGKSGVGGGIIAIYPDKYAIAVWSPKLNKKGNSYKGMKFLEEFTSVTNLSIF